MDPLYLLIKYKGNAKRTETVGRFGFGRNKATITYCTKGETVNNAGYEGMYFTRQRELKEWVHNVKIGKPVKTFGHIC